jgi:hypothetical protein
LIGVLNVTPASKLHAKYAFAMFNE